MAEPSPTGPSKEIEAGRSQLAAWYRDRAEAYPWRRGIRDPYRILVCEFMAQQTQAARVAVAFDAWIERFPAIGDLAAASRAEVLRAWQGLGYNRRAIALHETAKIIVTDHGGNVPADVDTLLSFPGIGPYTAAAVSSIAFGLPVVALDTNVRRVAARALHGVEPDELPPARLRADAQAWLDPADPGSWNQAVMDVGATCCRPRAPRCETCPLEEMCAFRRAGRVGRSSVRRQPAFEGSFRQIRGAVVRTLSIRGATTPRALESRVGSSADAIDTAVEALVRDGLIERTPDGKVRLRG